MSKNVDSLLYSALNEKQDYTLIFPLPMDRGRNGGIVFILFGVLILLYLN